MAARRDATRLLPIVVVLAMLGGCQARPGRAAWARPGSASREPWALLVDGQGLWVVLGDRTLARYDAAGWADGAPVQLPFTPGAVAAGHGDLGVGGQVEGRRRVTAGGSYPVIQVARVDPRRRAVTGLITLPARSNGNQLVSTPDAVWVSDPAEGRQSRIWRIDPATNGSGACRCGAGRSRWLWPCQGGAVWSANHDDGTLRRLAAAPGPWRPPSTSVEPHGMAMAPGAIWVADAHHQAVLRVDPASGRTVARIPVGFEPGPLAATPAAVWVARATDPDLPPGPVVRIDPASNRVTAEVPVGGRVTALASGHGQAWAAASGPHALLRLPA